MAVFSSAVQAQDSDQEERITSSTEVFEEVGEMAEKGIPPALLRKSGGVVIIPKMIKGGLILGGQRGKGLALLHKKDGTWSNPVFVKMTGGSFGLQIGVQKIELVLVFKNRRALERIGDSDFKVGADASVAAGPVGRQASAGTNIEFEAAIYSYSRTEGVFAGLSLDGTLIKVDDKANGEFYGQEDITAVQIYELEETPVTVSRLHEALQRVVAGKDKSD